MALTRARAAAASALSVPRGQPSGSPSPAKPAGGGTRTMTPPRGPHAGADRVPVLPTTTTRGLGDDWLAPPQAHPATMAAAQPARMPPLALASFGAPTLAAARRRAPESKECRRTMPPAPSPLLSPSAGLRSARLEVLAAAAAVNAPLRPGLTGAAESTASHLEGPARPIRPPPTARRAARTREARTSSGDGPGAIEIAPALAAPSARGGRGRPSRGDRVIRTPPRNHPDHVDGEDGGGGSASGMNPAPGAAAASRGRRTTETAPSPPVPGSPTPPPPPLPPRPEPRVGAGAGTRERCRWQWRQAARAERGGQMRGSEGGRIRGRPPLVGRGPRQRRLRPLAGSRALGP